MNGINALRKLFGLWPMDEAGTDGGQGGGGDTPAPATDLAPAPAADGGTVEDSSLLSGDPAADADKPADDKPTEEGSEAEGDADKDKDKKLGAPEQYEAFTPPEGVEVDETVLPEIQQLFKDFDLPQEKAQEMFERLLQIQEKQFGTQEEQMQRAEQQIIALNSKFAEECRNLPEIGGEKFAESLTAASRVMQTFGSKELRSLVALTGVGSHPEFFKMMVAIGSKMSPDTFVNGGEASQTDRRPADEMFGHLFQN